MIRFRALHNTAVSYSDVPNQLWAVNNHHKNRWGMKSSLGFYIGYHGFIDGNGTFTQTRLIGEETIAIKGHNCDRPVTCDTVSFCAAFNGDKEVLNQAQRKTLKRLYSGEIELRFSIHVPSISLNWDITKLEDKFHRDLQSYRTCPGKLITYDYIKDILKDEQMSDKKQLSNLQVKLNWIQQLVERLRAQMNLIIKNNNRVR